MFECKHGCGKKTETRGGMNLHEYHCGLQKGQVSSTQSSTGCQHTWRALTNKEYALLQANGCSGFYEVCTKCDDIQ